MAKGVGGSAEKVAEDVRRKTRRTFSVANEKRKSLMDPGTSQPQRLRF
jgi:hypothetical protein